jgi:hypothetical protein
MISPLLECALAVDCFLEALVNLFEQDWKALNLGL